ncbi:MAG: anchored repeat-type ABC transporter ATP-binding subunit [Acidimicrobiia bacterium]
MTGEATNPNPLSVSGLAVELGQRRVLHDVDLSMTAGEVVGLIGPNGAGKTTLLRAVLGLLPYQGTVLIAGKPPGDGRTPIGYVPQRHEFAWDFPITVEGAVMTGRTRMIGWLRKSKAADRSAVGAALERVRMTDLRHRAIGELSGGQRQRVLVARALAMDPTLLLFDEPYTGVDVPTQELLTELIEDLLADGRALLMTTHDLSSASKICTRLCLLNQTVVATGTPEELADPSVWLKAFGVDSSTDLIAAITRHAE